MSSCDDILFSHYLFVDNSMDMVWIIQMFILRNAKQGLRNCELLSNLVISSLQFDALIRSNHHKHFFHLTDLINNKAARILESQIFF